MSEPTPRPPVTRLANRRILLALVIMFGVVGLVFAFLWTRQDAKERHEARQIATIPDRPAEPDFHRPPPTVPVQDLLAREHERKRQFEESLRQEPPVYPIDEPMPDFSAAPTRSTRPQRDPIADARRESYFRALDATPDAELRATDSFRSARGALPFGAPMPAPGGSLASLGGGAPNPFGSPLGGPSSAGGFPSFEEFLAQRGGPNIQQLLGAAGAGVPSAASTSSTSAFRHLPTTDPNASTVYASSRVAAPPGTLQAGTVLPATLITGLNSDLPGPVLAQIRRDVYDSATGRHLMVPAGTRLVGTYQDQVAVGQDRVLVAWSRILFPDGTSVQLPGLPSLDLTGAAGLHDKVNHHTFRVFGQAILLGIVSAGFQLSQSADSGLADGQLTEREIAADAVGQELARAASRILQSRASIPPTITVRPGTAFNVFLAQDLVLGAPSQVAFR